jgi:hypothetical protein
MEGEIDQEHRIIACLAMKVALLAGQCTKYELGEMRQEHFLTVPDTDAVVASFTTPQSQKREEGKVPSLSHDWLLIMKVDRREGTRHAWAHHNW